MSEYHFNNFGGLVVFSLPPKRFFARFLLRGTQRTRRYITRYVWVSRDVGGVCTGRLKSLGLTLFSGAASPNQKSRHYDMKTGKGTLSSGVFTSVSGIFFNNVAGAAMFLYVETLFNVRQRCLWRTHMLNYLSNTCLLYTSPSPRDKRQSRMPSSA